ncbi:hypothetical protein FQA39_LY16014 [Lamprigera yunnana]|nr:hypothetical protein FQA39_LY16014 [Lamprigera yunnana]
MSLLALKISIVLLVVCATSCNANKIEDILESVPKEDRLIFLKYHIALGYTLENEEKVYSPSPRLAHDVTLDIYKYFMSNYRIQNEELLKTLREIVCLPTGECINIGDPGVHPD